MRDERTVDHPMKDDILQMPRDAFPAPTGISDNGSESRENGGTRMRGPAASSASEANDLPDGLMDVPQVAKRFIPLRFQPNRRARRSLPTHPQHLHDLEEGCVVRPEANARHPEVCAK